MRKGFTLIEMMIVTAIIGVILPVVYSVFMYGMLTYNTGAAQVEIFRSAQPVIILLQNDMREAVGVVNELEGIKTSKDCIILEKMGQYVCYYQNKGALIRKVFTKEKEGMQRLGSCLKNITFEYSKEPLITFRLSFLQNVGGKDVKLDLSSGVLMRNWRKK